MRRILLLLIMVWFCSVFAISQEKNLYDFSTKTIDGETLEFSSLKGKKVLIVNVASKCGLTPQYE